MGSKPQGISASRGAAILGLSKWKTPMQVWLKIIEEQSPGFCAANGYEIEESEMDIFLEMGIAFEEPVCKLLESHTGDKIIDRERLYKHEIYDFVTCHIDGRYFIAKKIHEGKTTNIFYWKDNFGEPGTDRIPSGNQIQVQHQMLCTGIDECVLTALVFPKRQNEFNEIPKNPYAWAELLMEMGYFHKYMINANPELQEKMLSHYWDFWRFSVMGCRPPRPKNYDDIRRLVIAPRGTIVASEQLERWSSEYKGIGSEIAIAGKRKNELKTLILEYMYNLADVPIDHESQEKWILKSRKGKNLHTFNGKRFR